MQKRQTHLIISGILVVVGVIMFGCGSINEKSNPNNEADSDKENNKQWSTLIKYDESTQISIKRLELHGPNAIEELKKAFFAIGDPSQLPKIAEQIAEKLDQRSKLKSEAKLNAMNKHGIRQEDDQYIYKGYKYNNVEDVIAYAEHVKRI